MFIGKYNKSVILTYIGLISSLVGIYFCFLGIIKYAMIFFIFSGICDLFDGKVARMCKRTDEEKEFGVQIDSLVDVVSFLALPCIMGLYMFKELNIVLNIILLFYVLAGIIRLAWFNMNVNKEGVTEFYIGLPVTYSAVIIPLIYIINILCKITNFYIFAVVYGLIGIAFILNVKIPKPKGIWYVIFGILAIVVSILILMIG